MTNCIFYYWWLLLWILWKLSHPKVYCIFKAALCSKIVHAFMPLLKRPLKKASSHQLFLWKGKLTRIYGRFLKGALKLNQNVSKQKFFNVYLLMFLSLESSEKELLRMFWRQKQKKEETHLLRMGAHTLRCWLGCLWDMGFH